MFICPVCKQKLILEDKSYRCKNAHTFDRAKKGYVNLLMSQVSGARHHGDDKIMAAARRDFLNSGHYQRLSELIASLLPGGICADIGCGECYYLEKIHDMRPDISCVGIDISKEILEVAALRTKPRAIPTAVASGARLPFADGTLNSIVSLFAPISAGEFYRVLKDDGVIVRALPGREHLFELKAAVYDKPVYNDEVALALEGFELADVRTLKYTLRATGAQIKNLFTMTPYYYKTSKEDIAKLDKIESLNITADFKAVLYNKRFEKKT